MFVLISIVYNLTDHLGNAIASAMSPAVFLTDDHKARPTKPDSIDLRHIPSLAVVANGPNGSRNNSTWTSAASSMPSSAASSQASSQASSTASSALPSRSNSFDNLADVHTSSQAVKSRRNRLSKPYNLEARPTKIKRNLSKNRLSNFAMTPLPLSQPNSPKYAVSPLPSLPSLPPDYLQQANEPLQEYVDHLNGSAFTAAMETYPSPGSSLSAPSTPGISLDSFAFPSGAGLGSFGPGDDNYSAGSSSIEQSPLYTGFTPLPALIRTPPVNLAQSLAALDMTDAALLQQQAQALPKISRLIPNEGSMHGKFFHS